MEPLKIKRTIQGQEVEIVLTWDEMWRAREITGVKGCMEDIQDMFSDEIPENELREYADQMYDYTVFNNFGWQEARDTVIEENGLYNKYE